MTIPINLKPFRGKATNELRTRSPLNFPNISSRGKILVTIENKYTIDAIDPETAIDPNAVGLISLANMVGIPSFRFAGDDMKATTSFLLEYDEVAVIQAGLDALEGKIYIDWFEGYEAYLQNKYRNSLNQYDEATLNAMTTTELSNLITEIETKLNVDIVITGTGSNGGILKADKVNAILEFIDGN